MTEPLNINNANHTRLSLAGILVALYAADDMQQRVLGAMEQFVVDEVEEEPDIIIRTRWGKTYDDSGGSLLFDSGSIWRLYATDDNGFEFRLAAPFSDWRPFKTARFNSSWTRGEIICDERYFEPGKVVYPLEYPLDEVLISNMLAAGRGIEIHGCALSDDEGNGYLFAGQSGAGKSTMALLWSNHEGIKILSDERVIIRRGVDGQFHMHGTPWHGDAGISSTTSAPLSKIFLLGRGHVNELVPQAKPQAAARLFACSFPPFYSSSGIAYTLEFLDELTQQVECCELRFVPDEKVIRFIREQVKKVKVKR
ncbi:MAG: hypothetical protein AUG51_10250 [Acidobacteria bacterium 13_1_20CM_3_53_8]|nr:MAG: hypothetical protein AUG51_10250 [Acidobacteria bacterium 13_1_20CM_3_53_8]